MKTYFRILVLSLVAYCSFSESPKGRDGKLLPVFQVVRFPNDPCYVTGGTKNGTCYTSEECSNKGGVNIGSCAEGFGVCCTFTLGCGGKTSENCTYFDSATTPSTGACGATICKTNSNICQIRLDFNSFVITGPSTLSTTVGKILAGTTNVGGNDYSFAMSQCLTDTFSVTNQNTVQTLCGTNTGYHAYFDASDECNSLNFQLGTTATGIGAIATRAWSIKVSQYSCDYINKAPKGCTQWHFGPVSSTVQSFNYQEATLHLAKQNQVICVRRETGMCRICWASPGANTVDISTVIATMGAIKHSKCGSYGDDGKKGGGLSGWDVLFIPGAIKKDDNTVVNDRQCGKDAPLVTATGAIAKTICSKDYPFRVLFLSDNYEFATEGGQGFQLHYTMTSC